MSITVRNIRKWLTFDLDDGLTAIRLEHARNARPEPSADQRPSSYLVVAGRRKQLAKCGADEVRKVRERQDPHELVVARDKR